MRNPVSSHPVCTPEPGRVSITETAARVQVRMVRRMRFLAVFLLALVLGTTAASVAAPSRVVSTFLCTDEYVFRLVPRAHIAALSFEAGDRHPVVSTIVDRVRGIAQIRP